VTAHLDETRTAYDTVAVDYAALFRDALADDPYDRAMLGLFAELVGAGPVLEAGCGPGRITAHLASLGLDVSGVDLSPEMIEVARRDHPALRFSVGTLASLDVADAALDGLVAWFSIIHTPPPLQPDVFREFRRVLAPGRHLLLAFQVGDDQRVRLEQAYGHEIALDAYRLSPDRVSAELVEAGFEMRVVQIRQPEGPQQKSPAAYLLAR
jgi:SAM-dependent methyltransferase